MENKEENLGAIFFIEAGLLFFVFLIFGIFFHLSPILPFILYLSLLFFSYLLGTFEPLLPPFYGLNWKTQVGFFSTLAFYLLIRKLFGGVEVIPFSYWLILWLYLNFFEPCLNYLFYRKELPVIFINDHKDNPTPKVLRFSHLSCQKIITKEKAKDYLATVADRLGRIKGVWAVVVADADERIRDLAKKYLTNFFLLKPDRFFYFGGRLIRELETSFFLSFGMRIKRIFDFLFILILLLFFTPLFLLIAFAIKLDSPGPVFYRHKRIGRKGRSFYLLKFRTMVVDADKKLAAILATDPKLREEFERTYKLKNDPRITRFGRYLRPLSIDELPQLINVLFGDMSLVGPRPIVEDEIEYYKDVSLLPFKFFPGVTGLWQTSGRTDTSYERRVLLDEHYCRNWNLLFDFKLLLKTIPTVLSQRGAY